MALYVYIIIYLYDERRVKLRIVNVGNGRQVRVLYNFERTKLSAETA